MGLDMQWWMERVKAPKWNKSAVECLGDIVIDSNPKTVPRTDT